MATRFRTSWTSQEGAEAALIVQGKIVNINLSNWTVDVVAQYDRKRYFDIQVSSPYLHYSNGEGIYTMPEVGAVCMVAIPSDSAPPFVLAFLMPHTFVNSSSADAEQGTTSSQTSQFATDASFDGGRKAPKPGDIVLRTRDSNFVILHRGGVLQIGATELAQRIYIPLNNLITDISENFAHHNASGTIRWGIQDGPSSEHFPCEYMHTFRVFADDDAADVRVLVGKVQRAIGEPGEEDGDQTDLDQLEIGNDTDTDPIVCEVAVTKLGWNAGSGDPSTTDTSKNTVLRFFFDRKGAAFVRCKSSLLISTKKKLKIKATEEMEIEAKSLTITMTDSMDLSGGKSMHLKADLVRLGSGTQAVARQGDVVTVTIPPGIIPVMGVVGPGVAAGSAVTGFLIGGQLVGTITSGNSAVQA